MSSVMEPATTEVSEHLRGLLDTLERGEGVAIVSTHLGKGFCPSGRLDPAVDALLREIASRGGWLAPVSEILDHLRAAGGSGSLSSMQIARIELRFLLDQVAERARLRLSQW